MTNIATSDGLEVPAFLRVTPEVQAQRDAWNAAHPVVPEPFIRKAVLTDADLEAIADLEAAKKATAKVKRENRAAIKEQVAQQDRAISDGKVWRNGRWVLPDMIGHLHAKRIMRELPTDKHRAIFIRDYGHRVDGGVRMPKRKMQ